MAEILKEWLTERLQRPINWQAEEFGDLMKNGQVIAGVLLSYRIINDEKYFFIRSSNSHDDIKSNWYHLREWLRDVDINLNDQELVHIKEGRCSELLRLFYNLFLQLDKRDRTNFIKRERKMVSAMVDKLGNRFKVEKVPEQGEPFVDNLSKPLLNEKHFIEWQRKKEEQVKDTYDYIRHKYAKTLSIIEESKTPLQYIAPKASAKPFKEITEMEQFALRYPCKFENYTYEQLLEMDEKVFERMRPFDDSEWAKGYMENLHLKLRKRIKSEEFQKQVRNVLSGSLWNQSVTEEETNLDIELAKKVMKLSQFEKQMCTQIMETKQQARNIVKNRIKAEDEFNQQRTFQFQQYLDNVKEQINLEVVEIDFEKGRQNMLHKKLYAEKIKRKRQHYYEICYETMLSIVDYATKYAYFKKLLEDDIPDHFIHEWKILYYKNQPVFDILDSVEDILKEHEMEEELVAEEEEIIRLELDRQEVLNENEFIEYHNYTGPWHLEQLIPNYDSESEERKYEYLGTRILGHIVYTLLDIKYPYPPPRPPADLPNYASKVLLRGLPDKSITTAMQILLNASKIHVVRLECAINFCLRCFKNEMIGCSDIDLSFDKFLNMAKTDDDKELIKLIKSEDDSLSKSSDLYVLGPIPPNTKQIQTPKTIPEEEIKLSNAAELGQYAYDALSFGESLTDHLLAAMIVEYLKDQIAINGFVIINYPNSYREAVILEETFSGREPPLETDLEDRDDIYLEESIIKHRKKEKDPYKLIRVSKIVNDPHKKRIAKPFDSYFTCYIKLKETADILQEFFIWHLAEDNSELIDRFYAALGINYSMYYEVIEKDLLAQICKYVIGDYSIPLKSCDTLFGENVLSLLDFPYSDDRRTKSKIVKPEISTIKSKDRLRRSSKISKSSTFDELEVVKAANSIDAADEHGSQQLIYEEEARQEVISNITLEEVNMLAGEEDWDYGELPIPEIIGIALATCWEQIEKTYVHDMEQSFFAVRLQFNCLVPYARFLKDKMEQIITIPSHKQDLVMKFQKEYNDFENDWRDVNLTKNEWHCRIKELQNKLYHICDERKLHAEQKRQALICENWAIEELTSMANTYISCMQAELNRSVLTYQALHDFYFTMIKRMPPNDRLISKELTKIYRDITDDGSVTTKKGGEDKVYRQLKLTFQELQLKDIQIDYSNNPFNLIIENNVKFASKVIKDLNDSYRSLISREYSEVAKLAIAPKKKEDIISDSSVNQEEIFKENALKCIDEWTMGINGEMYRACLRILALQYKCYRDMKLFNDHIYKTFMDIQNDINNYYMNEIKSVDRLCKYLQMAVENGRKIPETLLLEHDTFVIDPNLLQYPPHVPTVKTGGSEEVVSDIEFRVGQLALLRSQLKIVAPTGIILQQAFIYLLQDFFFFSVESCNGALFPEAWKHINVEQMPKLVFLLFGETSYIDWRDFLIYCLNIRMPTVEELLQVRQSFRCLDLNSKELISRDEFIRENLWFETDFDIEDKNSLLRKNLIKHFLFELFETAPNLMNYSAFLLAFCKATTPLEGFATALSMAVGKKICFNIKECHEVVCKLIKLKQYRDQCLACAIKCTQQFLDMVIKNVINICESTTITELEYTEPPSEDKKGKKGKSPGGKGKKANNNQSARSLKLHKTSSVSKIKLASTTQIKQTYICRPCEGDDEAMEEKPQEKEEVEEEQKSEEPQEDPNLAYAVSQAVIWNVLKICLPWHFQLMPEEKVTPYISHVCEAIKSLEGDTDSGDIYVCKFVLDQNVCKLLHKVKKFTALNLSEEVRKVVI